MRPLAIEQGPQLPKDISRGLLQCQVSLEVQHQSQKVVDLYSLAPPYPVRNARLVHDSNGEDRTRHNLEQVKIWLQDERPFVSAKRVLRDIGGPIADELELISFHTVSKGVIGATFGWLRPL